MKRFIQKAQKKITAEKPTYIGRVDGVSYFEHPFKGDEAPLLAKLDGSWFQSDHWELPESEAS